MEIEKVEQYANQFEIINGLQSVTLLYKSINRAMEGDQASAYHLPVDSNTWKKVQRDLDTYAGRELGLFISDDLKWGRMTGSWSDAGSDSIGIIQEKLMAFASSNTDTSLVQFRMTGTSILFDKNNVYIRQSIFYGILVALLVISVLMALLYKDKRMLLIAIIPNLIPLVICGALLGFLNLALDAPTAIIFGISYGIVVDDTIHFLSRFNIERNKGTGLELSIYKTFRETGKALFITTFILFFGFSILVFSDLQATINVGMLIACTLITALVTDVYLLPLMLRKWLK
jgi:predicted RND superfamily exporter protein